jgi:hypothetical protein
MAGQGWREWQAGEQLTDDNMQQFLQDQSVMRFADATARGTALAGVVSEGMVSWLDDVNQLEVYDGSAWGAVTPDVASATKTAEGVVYGLTGDETRLISPGVTGFSFENNVSLGILAGGTAIKNNNQVGNVVVGSLAGTAITTAHTNTVVGGLSGASLTTGTNNVFLGAGAGISQATSSFNVAVGTDSLFNNGDGSPNVAVGHNALFSNITGDNNVAVGFRALYNTTGSENTALGDGAGGDYLGGTVTGSNNTSIGNAATPSTTSVSNQITLGNSSVTSLRCQVTTLSALSDIRDKTNVQDSTYGLDLINQLRPVTFDWNMRDGAKVGVPDLGFIAQELAEVEDNYDAERLALTLRDNPDKLEATPGRLIPILVKAIQELSARIEELENEC